MPIDPGKMGYLKNEFRYLNFGKASELFKLLEYLSNEVEEKDLQEYIVELLDFVSNRLNELEEEDKGLEDIWNGEPF